MIDQATTSENDEGFTSLSCRLHELAHALRQELEGGENPCAVFTRFVAEAYQNKDDALSAGRELLEIFASHQDALGQFARVVDVAAELQHGSRLLADAVVQIWDQPKEEHKLSRLADEILNSPELYANDTARVFTVRLAKRLALQRPELAARLIDLQPVESEVLADDLGTVRVWLKAGEFIRTQSEAVRYFWQKHLRHPSTDTDWSRMNVQMSLQAVRFAPMDVEVAELLESSVPAEVWDKAAQPVETKPVIKPVEESSMSAVIVPRAKPPAPPQGALRPAYAGAFKRMNGSASSASSKTMPSWAKVAAGVIIGGGVLWLSVGNDDDTEAPLVAVSAKHVPELYVPSIPAAPDEQSKPKVVSPAARVAKPAPSTVVEGKSVAKVVPTKPAEKPVISAPAKVPVVAQVTKPGHKPVVAPTKPEPKPQPTAIAAVPSAQLPRHFNFARPMDVPRSGPPLKPVSSTRAVPSLAPAVVRPQTQSIASSPPPPPAPPVESVAKPAALTAHDRWVMAETRALATRFPELIEMQRAVVKGTWNESIMKIDGTRPVVSDHERYLALLRWLVIDPPLPDKTRLIVLRTWSKAAQIEDCISLWEQIVKGNASHVPEIAHVASEMLAGHMPPLTADQKRRLEAIAVGTTVN
ncbi:MAG: hypothetical protein JNM99_20260 [Verrucomicrobiaceae bacterium]|nr:hypothetical protein [Verrucomicrobiaceae bacterium]